MIFKHVLILFFILSSSSAFAARWTCESICFLFSCGPDYNGSSTVDLDTYGSTQAEARRAAEQKCEEAKGTACLVSSLGDPVRCTEAAPPPPQHYKIVYKNNCRSHGEIWTAIHYKTLAGDWETHGYWNIAYGETKVVANTKNRFFDIHGHTSNNIVWGSNSNMRTIHNVNKAFSQHEIGSGTAFGTYTFSFGCD